MIPIKRREITLILVSIMVLLLFFSGYSMGKEYRSISFEANGKIAEPIMIVENSPTVEVNGDNDKEYYYFKVKNYKETGEVTQVDLQYQIEILSQIEESISFKLYKNKEEILLKENKTENMKLEKERIQEDEYELEIIYDKNKSTAGKNILQEVQIKVHSEQWKL